MLPLLPLALSCGGKESEAVDDVPVLAFETPKLTIGWQEAGRTFRFSSSDVWIVEYDADWFTLNGEQGDGSEEQQSLTLSFTPNRTRFERRGTVTLYNRVGSVTMTVVQQAPVDATISDFYRRVRKENYAWQYFCAHRASTYDGTTVRRDCPENSVAAIKRCIRQRIDMAEIDVRQTADGVLVCNHDATIDAVTTGTGTIADMTYAEICKYDLTLRQGSKGFAGMKMSTLSQILRAAKDSIWLNLDVKVNTAAFRQAVVDTLRAAGMLDQVSIYVGTSTDKARSYYDLSSHLSINLYVGDPSAAATLSDLSTVTVCQFGLYAWDTSADVAVACREAGFCSFANMLTYDAKIATGKTEKLDLWTAAKVDFMQTDIGDHPEMQKYLKKKRLR